MLAETYLTQTRGFPRPATGWPPQARFHPGRRALVVAASDPQAPPARSAACPPHRRLPKGRKHGTASYQAVLRCPVGSAVRLPGKGREVLLAEGPETGLACWTSTGAETWICLNGFRRMDLPADGILVVCGDDDAPEASVTIAREAIVAAWRTEGRHVAVATPWAIPRGDKTDLDDALRKTGPEHVRNRILDVAASVT